MKEKLEIARLKHQEAKDRKETTLLMAATQRFDEFQKEEHRKAVKRMGEMLFGNDGMKLPVVGSQYVAELQNHH